MMSPRGNLFQVLGVPILAGRSFTLQDNATAPKVAMINEALAQQYFPIPTP
jgi:putative ABC transport system permease protein